MQDIEKFKKIIDESRYIVFFGGAGVSTESGIPDFRSATGIFTTSGVLSPETVVSRGFFYSRTKEFYEFYRGKMLFPDAKPNYAHVKLAELEKQGKLKAVITQNIDGLHQMAGSENVIELHGSALRNHCQRCGAFYGMKKILEADGVPTCDECGGVIKPDVVLYGESLPADALAEADRAIGRADTLIVGGTSLSVYPAASFVYAFRGKNLIVINRTPTDADKRATLLFRDNIGEVFARL